MKGADARPQMPDPVYRRRALEFAADALLCAAAFALAFKLRFLDERMPERYETMLVGSIAFVALGKAAVLEVLGMHQQWWRYFRLPDLWPLFRSLAIASALMVLVFVLAKPYPDGLPRSVVILDLILACALLGARLARRSLAERPARRAGERGLREVLVVGAGSGGQMVVRELKLNPNLGARAIGFLDDDPRKRGMRTEGLKVIGTTDEIGPICDRLAPDEVVIAIHPPQECYARRSSPRAAIAGSRCERSRPCSSCFAAACSSPASCARSGWRTSSAAIRWSWSSSGSALTSRTSGCW